MRVLVATTAGEGHAAPLFPFARACASAGAEVRVAAPRSFAGTVEAAGLHHAPFDDADPAELQAVWARLPGLPREEANAVVIGDVFGGIDARAALPGVQRTVETWRPDVVLREPAEVASYVVAEAQGLPHVQVAIGLASLDDLLFPLLAGPLRVLGADLAGARAAPRWTGVPAGLDVAAAEVTGATSRFRTLADTLPAALPAWWRRDEEPLVYVTFGSVAAGIGFFPDLYRAAVDALAELPVRVLITTGAAAEPQELGPLPDSVHVERWWPQHEVLPHAAAVVCHGGFGTTLPTLAAGVPLVVLPLFASDQYLTAARVQEVGAGLSLPDGPAGLAAAVERVLSEGAFRDAARRLAAEVRTLPAVATCVAELEQIVRSGRPSAEPEHS